MPRDIPVGNGQMLVTFDRHYRLRDLYFPHVGQENHVGAPCRFGVWTELPKGAEDRRRKRVYWSDDGWDTELRYVENTLATDVTMRNEELALELHCNDVVDFHRNVLVRRIDIHNRHHDTREVRLFHHQDFYMYGSRVGDTAYFDPQIRSLIHYRKNRYLMACFYQDGDQQTDEYATGTSGFGGAEGTWRDAEDGVLGNNPISQGAVDSTMMVRTTIPGGQTKTVYLVIGAAFTYDGLDELHRFVHRESPQGIIERTQRYWRLWLDGATPRFVSPAASGLSAKVHDLYKRSLLVVRTQCDNQGAIIAANDSDIMQFSRDTYSYLWPRDGAFVADAMDSAGFGDIAKRFFKFCNGRLHKRGMFLHKYCPDGSEASSWHPWVDHKGRPQMPIQEDETALVIWALWRHFERCRDIEFTRPMWSTLIRPAADFMVMYRDPDTKLPLPSYDLWEERYGVHAFTVATVYAGLDAAAEFAHCFGDAGRARRYRQAAEEVREAFGRHLWSDKLDRFYRRVMPSDGDRNAKLMGEVFAGRAPGASPSDPLGVKVPPDPSKVKFENDENIDASMFAIFALDLLPVDDARVRSTMEQVRDRLTIKTDVGGVARYIDDYYHQVTNDVENVPGNPWFICTLWMADYDIAKARNMEELKAAAAPIEWVADRALLSGVLAEQVHPMTNDPLSVSPLTWSHATVVATVTRYLQRLSEFENLGNIGMPGVSGQSPMDGRVLTTR